jgi:hypothetical protein
VTTVATTDLTAITDITDPTLHDDPAALGQRTASACVAGIHHLPARVTPVSG